MRVILPHSATMVFMAHVSITSAFVSPEMRRGSSATPVSSASLLPLSISSSYNAPFMTCIGGKRLPSRWVPYSQVITRQFQLHASLIEEETEESGQPQSKQVVIPQTASLKELASQIDTKSSRRSAAEGTKSKVTRPRYQLGVGKNMPLSDPEQNTTASVQKEDPYAALNWNVPEPAKKEPVPEPPAKKEPTRQRYDMGLGRNSPLNLNAQQSQDGDSSDDTSRSSMRTTIRLLPKGDEESARLTKAVWDEGHFDESESSVNSAPSSGMSGGESALIGEGTEAVTVQNTQQQKITDYQQIDLSIPPSVYSLGASSHSSQSVDLVWDLMRQEAQTEAAREPLLVSFLYSTILNHHTLEGALSFHLANRLSSPAMLSTQIMSLIREALDADPDFRRNLRADMLAVRDRDPACNCLPDVFLYFKGFHALQTYRVAHYLWRSGRRVLAHYLQSQVSQHFQIDIHPNATLGSGIMLDHGTGIVIGETAHLGHNCSVLHHVTLGGSGRAGFDRHPKIGNGVLLGAGASVLGNIKIGDGCQVGSGTLVIEDLPPRSVAVGVPAKIIGRFVDVTAQPSIGMNQLGSKESEENIVMFGMDGI
mmetsp:Transcript_37394/g.67256  ORF Transcript_37394/g.67256 Transcript_37394/m.67256 type:complete len:593 (-) Transcript_37394:190-1968(-)